MAIQQIPITRGGKAYTHYQGTDDVTGEEVDYIDQILPDENTGLPVRFEPARTTIERASKGAIAYIMTDYRRVLVDMNGNTIPGTETRFIPGGGSLTLVTNKVDEKYFAAGLGPVIKRHGTNGWVRGMMGFNALPVFDAAGTVLTYTAEQEAAEPTNDYHPLPVANEPAPDTTGV